MRHNLLKLVLTYLLFLTSAQGADIHISNTPDWVKPLQLPAALEYPEADIQNGIYYVFLDVQVHAPSGRPPSTFQHYAEHIVNQNGVQHYSQINLRYDPSYQTLQLHSLIIHRDGKRIDKTGTASMKVLQQEDEMNNLIYNGDHTLNIILDDVRVGDTIEYSFSRQGANPVYQGIFGFQHHLNWSVPVGEFQLRVVWGKPKPLFHRQINASLPLQERATAYGREYRIHTRNVPPLSREDNTPDWYDPWGRIQFSEVDTWQQVAQWGLGLYRNAWQGSKELDAIVADIEQNSDTDEERISKALRFVQGEIRYLGIELGENSHVPTAAAETLQRRYGDCKDKTVLLIAMLRKMGIKAHPALVNTELSHTLRDYLPSTRHFNHVITQVVHDDQTWWLDPTRTYQHGLISRIHQPDYGVALVLQPGSQDLVTMQPNNQVYGTKVVDRFELQQDLSQPTVYTTSTVYQGWNAENMRDSVASKGQAKLQKQYLEFFQYYYPGITTQQPLALTDDDRDNRLTVTEYYGISNFWNDKPDTQRHVANFYANSISSHLDIPDEPRRTDPLYLAHPYRLHQTIEVVLPDDDWFFEDEHFDEDNPFFQFFFKATFNAAEHLLTLSYEYQSRVESIPASDYPDYLAALKKVEDYQSYSIFQSYADATTASTDTAEAHWAEYLTTTNIILGFVAGYLLVFLLWRLEAWRHPESMNASFYPITLSKFLFMWVFSLGTYAMYWFYRNYKYIKQQQDKPMMPVARGLFYWAWYFNLWQALKTDSESRNAESHLPPKAVAILMALVFLVCAWAVRDTLLWLIGLLVSAALCLPLANYILNINQQARDAIHRASRWRPRHLLLCLLSTPVLLLGAGQQLGILPSVAVIEGDRLWKKDIKTLQRNGITQPGDELLYFYSDGFLSIMEDGNGITDRHVFSYWQEDGRLQSMTATFDEIDDIEVTQGATKLENTVVSVKLKNGNDFLLFLSREDQGDRRFISELRSRIGKDGD